MIKRSHLCLAISGDLTFVTQCHSDLKVAVVQYRKISSMSRNIKILWTSTVAVTMGKVKYGLSDDYE